MKLSDVVSQMQAILPKYTDLFSSSLGISSISVSGGVATITTSLDHNLLNGEAVNISGVAIKTAIDAVVKDGLVFTFGVVSEHDLTQDYPGYEDVTIGGFTDVDWNDDFTLLDVPTRLTFKVNSTNSLPTLNGNEYLSEVKNDGINGRHSATVVDTDIFTVTGDFIDGTYISGEIKTGVRIAGSVTAQRAAEQYTEQALDDLWMFVVMNDASVSKDRNTRNDSVATIANGEDIRMRLVDGFSLLIIQNTSDEVAAVDSMDIARHDLLSPIMKSVFGVRFDTGLSGSGDFRVIPLGHSFIEYDRATFMYQYNFQFTFDLTGADAADEQDTRAFREIDYTHTINGDDTDDLTVTINTLPDE